MPWGWILSALLIPAGLVLLALALFHVRLRASWGGAWESLDSKQAGSFRIEYGFPGFMRAWDWEDDEDQEDKGRGEAPHPQPPPYGHPLPPLHPNATRDGEGEGGIDPSPSTFPGLGGEELPPVSQPPSRDRRPRRRARNRWRRALFHFATDRKAWAMVAKHGFGTARGALGLLRPRIAIAVGHPDPVKLARLAGWWHASAPLLSAKRATLELRFQDRRPTFAIRAEGGFSVLSLLLFGIGRTSAFPWIGLGRRVWTSWWRHELEGWRKWAYERIQE